jgi:hypothetical protein
LKEDLQIIKTILGDQEINKQWFKGEGNLYRVLKYYVFINRFLATDPNAKTYNLLPMGNVRRHFITIDTHSLFGIAKDCDLINCNNSIFVSQGIDEWKAFLDFESVMGRGKTFTGTIETDGLAVCLHFTKPIVRSDSSKTKTINMNDPNIDIVGLDPGRTSIYYAVKVDAEGNPKGYRLTRSHYYQASGIINSRKQVQNWNSNLSSEIALLSLNSPKPLSITLFQKYIATVLDVYDTIWNEWTKKRWSDQRLRLYGGKKRVFAKFWNEVATPGKKTVVAFGSAKFAPGGKSEMSVPTTRAFKECSYRFQTIPVDEFRTSKIYWKDQQTLLHKVKRLDSDKEVRGLLWCGSTNQERSKLINRDLNAAINIRNCLIASERPRFLKRMGSPALVQRHMAFLKC